MTPTRPIALLALLSCCALTAAGCIDARDSLDDPADSGAGGNDSGGSVGDGSSSGADASDEDGGDAADAGGSSGSSGSSGASGSSGSSGSSGGATGCKDDAECAADIADFPCKSATCDKATGDCEYANKKDGVECGTTDKCVMSRLCKAGACVVSKTADCDDDDSCTLDKCIVGKGCQHAPASGTPCDDQSVCTTGDVCKQGKCVGTEQPCAQPANKCLKALCGAKQGCKNTYVEDADGVTPTCDDDNKCTVDDVCAKGKCKGKDKKCDDAKECWLTTCLPDKDCQSQPVNGMKCDDGDPCTKDDACGGSGEVKCQGEPDKCDDGNPCTKDSCDKALPGCKHVTETTASCDDGDPCTDKDSCTTGKCEGTAKKCDDGNLCTKDECVGGGHGCKHYTKDFDGNKCEDGDVCTENDSCKKGGCVGGTQKKCTDGLECTTDSQVCNHKDGGCKFPVKKFGVTTCGGGTSHCWYEGVCVAPKCDNGTCEYGETSSCAKDCPAGGGRCTPTDATCMGKCETDHCGAAAKACDGDAGCKALRTCAAACKDFACKAACIGKANAAAQDKFDAITFCTQAKCAKNGWHGINCEGSGPSYNACLSTCQSGFCYRAEALCQANAKCKTADACIANCAASGDCITKCKDAAGTAAFAMQDALAQCRNLHCDKIQ